MKRVKFISAEMHRKNPKLWPPVGTMGTVTIDRGGKLLVVEWDKHEKIVQRQWVEEVKDDAGEV